MACLDRGTTGRCRTPRDLAGPSVPTRSSSALAINASSRSPHDARWREPCNLTALKAKVNPLLATLRGASRCRTKHREIAAPFPAVSKLQADLLHQAQLARRPRFSGGF